MQFISPYQFIKLKPKAAIIHQLHSPPKFNSLVVILVSSGKQKQSLCPIMYRFSRNIYWCSFAADTIDSKIFIPSSFPSQTSWSFSTPVGWFWTCRPHVIGGFGVGNRPFYMTKDSMGCPAKRTIIVWIGNIIDNG